MATAHAAPADTRTLAEIPPDSVGGFIYTGGPIALHDLSSRGVRYPGLAGVELQGWLKARQSERYEFGEDLHGSLGPGSITCAPCLLQVWIAGRSVGSQEVTFPWWNGNSTEQRISLLVGADLQPGLYAIRLWTVCAAHNPALTRLTADLLLKVPSDLDLRGYKADELLHQP